MHRTIGNTHQWRSLLLLLSLLGPLLGCGEQSTPGSAADLRAAPPHPLPINSARIQAAGNGAEWLSYGGNYDEQRHSTLAEINLDNVNDLGVAWTYDLKTNRGVESTPIVVNGVMYATSAWSVVHAIDAKTGKEIWTYDPLVDKRIGGKACCDVVNRGVAVYGDQLFVGVIDGRLEALDAKTGQLNWSVETTDQSKPYTITGAPRVFNNKVLIGNGGAELGVRGYLSAYDAGSGDLEWRFYTVPNPSKEADDAASDAIFAKLANNSWGNEGLWVSDGGGGTVWDSIVYDTVNNTIIFGVGNGSPWNRNFRDPSGGDNLFLSSIVAVDADSGEYRWHYQTTPGDNWDYTATQSIILADLPLGAKGNNRRVVMQAPKNGFFYVLDAASGELISGNPFVSVNWATGLDKNGRPIENPIARYTEEATILSPGPLGAHNWQPMAYNPDLQLAYIPAQEIPGRYASNNEEDRPISWNTGTDFSANMPVSLTSADLTAMRAALKGRLIAWDPIKQSPRWIVEHDNAWNGGVLSTAGGLVFQGKLSGEFSAYNAATGEPLWNYDLRSGGASGPMTFEIDGEQYLTITTGWGSAFSLIHGYSFDQTLPPSVGKVVTFKLGARGSIAAPQLDLVARTPAAPSFGTEAQIKQGVVDYHTNCLVCHGVAAVSSGVLPDLRWSQVAASADTWRKVVIDGVLASNGMVSFSEYLSPEDAENIRAYVLDQAAAGVAADSKQFELSHVDIKSIKEDWLATGIWLTNGDEVTIAAQGLVDFGMGAPLEPQHLLWARIGDGGEIFQYSSNPFTFKAPSRGELHITASPPALLWADRKGNYIEAWDQLPDIPAALSVNIFAWKGSAQDGLNELSKTEEYHSSATAALEAINDTKTLPAGFEYLWYLNASNVFSRFDAEGRKGVHVSTDNDVGIIRKPVDIPLTEDTRFEFEWLYKQLPGLGPETDAATHDYSSIALEFDNGQDLTWFWSSHLAQNTVFACPLPDWQHRETHMVLQSGKEGLGQWHEHSRPVLEDYRAAIEGPVPSRIVAIWVIGNSLFGRQAAESFFANARIVQEDHTVPLL